MKIYVIGGANIDITGRSYKGLILKDSNPGNISISFGGVARNIAENLAKLGHKIEFISAFSTDFFGSALLKDLQNKGIGIKHSIMVNQASTSTYLALLNKDNDMEVAVSDMAILSKLSPKAIQPIIKKMTSQDILVLDTNLEAKTLDYIFKNSKAKIFVDPISTTKALKIKPYLKYIYAIKPNIYEAEVLTDTKLTTRKDIIKAGKILQAKGVKKVFITLGKMGAYGCYDKTDYFITTGSVSVKSATGAGDAFAAGIVSCESQNKSLLETIKFANACSIITLQSLKTVSDKINLAAINKLLRKK